MVSQQICVSAHFEILGWKTHDIYIYIIYLFIYCDVHANAKFRFLLHNLPHYRTEKYFKFDLALL